MQKPVFATVIIPTYNQAAYLLAALDSLLAQTDRDWEAIVVNDGSTDNTAEIADGYAQRDSRIRCIHKPNGGVASALNAGLSNARGEWIHWLSSDDMFEPEKLAINRRWIEKYPDTRFFFSYFTLLRDATGVRERRELWGPLPDPAHQLLTLLYRNFVSGISICVSRAAWEEVGFFDESLHYAQDYDQWLRLLQKNQGRFIPEWTVINRNHAAQGSETFADACYFDTAKAAIRFLNRHPFPELVPWVDLSDEAAATRAVVAALGVACERSAFLHALGPHPALVLRLLEWVLAPECAHASLIGVVRSRIAEMALQEGDDDWAWMWCQLAVAAHGHGENFLYRPIDITQLALREYRSRALREEASCAPLRDYLFRFEDIEVGTKLAQGEGGGRIAFLVDHSAEITQFSTATEQLAKFGYRPVVFVLDPMSEAPTWQWFGSVPIIRLAALDRDALPWLGEIELAIALPTREIPAWLGSLSQLVLQDGLSAADIAQQVMFAMGRGTEQSIRPVVFLERVLWGGGAERVVLDIVRRLNRRRYRPVILTMFDEHTACPVLLSDLQVKCVGHELSSAPPSKSVGSAGGVEGTPCAALGLGMTWLRRIYHGLLTPEIRQRIGLRQRLAGLRHKAKSLRIPEHELIERLAAQACTPDALDGKFLAFDFISAMAHHNFAAVGLAREMRQIGNNAAVIAVMEEAAVTAWLAQADGCFTYAVSLHSFESACLRDIYPSPSRFSAERRLLSAACNDAEVVTLPSEGCCLDLDANFAIPQARVRQLSNPVDCANVRRMSFQRFDAVERWQASTICFRMVHVGRLDSQKNHELLLAACTELVQRRRAFSLSIVGDGADRRAVEKQIETLGLRGMVALVGEQSNPFPWMAAADALMLTSRFESFALVLVEAMACGTPVISVDCPTGPAEVLNNGEFGLLVANNDPIALADAVERLMDDSSLAQRLSESGYERAQVFDVKRIVPQWEELIDALPQGRG